MKIPIAKNFETQMQVAAVIAQRDAMKTNPSDPLAELGHDLAVTAFGLVRAQRLNAHEKARFAGRILLVVTAYQRAEAERAMPPALSLPVWSMMEGEVYRNGHFVFSSLCPHVEPLLEQANLAAKLQAECETDLQWIENLLNDINAGRPLRPERISEGLTLRAAKLRDVLGQPG